MSREASLSHKIIIAFALRKLKKYHLTPQKVTLSILTSHF